ncbi:6-phosphogluconolactonase [Harpegnathos saltator]|uniref:6-phosphogluconolactonase n=1 Tax=Harpegnathos saltator TaxID=610380 RepID=E2B397_HARSA|nr:6-phosphogluconolactonase [Harpegnathos saltator]EFN89775.1 6-phosphogluconolactonase [Harpegnathos saltator]
MVEIVRTADEEDLYAYINNVVSQAADSAFLHGDGLFRIGVSGGSMVDVLAKCLPKIKTDWSKWRIFFCDERIVEPNDERSNLALYKNSFINKVPVTEEQFIQVDPNLSAEDAAMDYIKKISSFFPPDRFPRFDCLLLGVGPDGHTCSLFPNHTRALEEINMWVTWEVDAPKPPPCRISLTLPVINNARVCIFIATGSSKADIVKRILENKEDLPASRVKPNNGVLYWLLDKDAGSLLDSTP